MASANRDPHHHRGHPIVDRAVLAAYCQAYGRWVEAEEKLKETPLLFKTPSGHLQLSPWLNIANRQRELMGRHMAEIGLTPASRSRNCRRCGLDLHGIVGF